MPLRNNSTRLHVRVRNCVAYVVLQCCKEAPNRKAQHSQRFTGAYDEQAAAMDLRHQAPLSRRQPGQPTSSLPRPSTTITRWLARRLPQHKINRSVACCMHEASCNAILRFPLRTYPTDGCRTPYHLEDPGRRANLRTVPAVGHICPSRCGGTRPAPCVPPTDAPTIAPV